MNRERLLAASDRWFRLLLRLYPADFRDEMGEGLVETYRDRTREALASAKLIRLGGVWMSALKDSLRSGPGEHVRPAVRWRRNGNWGRDVEHAARRLVRAPALVAAVAGTLTLGLGMFAVVYTVVQKILIDPMPYKDPDDLYFVWRDYGPIFDLNRGWLGGTDVTELQKIGGMIEDAVGLRRQLATFTVQEGAEPAEISVMLTSPNLFEVLGVEPALGRGFARNEVGPGRPPVIVLTYDLWNRFGANQGILGTLVRLNGQAYTVIGVMPSGFAFVRHASLGTPQRADAYTTFDINLAETNPSGGSYAGLFRAKRGTSSQTVASLVDAVGRAIDKRDFKGRGLKLYSVGLKPDLVAPARPALLVLGVAGVFLVLILMVNLASVLLSRAAQREHEYAVTRALGANTGAVVCSTLAEGAILGVLGGIGGTIAAIWATRSLIALAPLDLPRRAAVAVDWRIGFVVVGVGLLLGIFAAIPPATWAARASLSSLLASSAVRGGGGHGRMRRGMVVVQVALTLVLLTTGGLVVRSFDRLLRADPGFKPEGVITIRVPMPAQIVSEGAQAFALQERLEQAFRSLPGVTSASASSALPVTASAGQTTVGIPGAPGNTGDAARDNPLVDTIAARVGYFEAMGMRLLEGRDFDRARHEDAPEAVIDHLLAKQFFPTGSALGAKIPFNKRSLTVVGVVQQPRLYDVHKDGRPQLFVRAEDWDNRTLSFVLRTGRDPHTLVPDMRAAIRQVDSRLAITEARTMDEIVGDALRQQRISAVAIAGFAVGALLLAAMGLFGVIAGSVTRRRHEFAVRLALGADHGRVLRLVLAEGAKLVSLGLLIGVPGLLLTGGLMQGVLVGVSPSDPPTLLAVALGLALVALVACYLPARRVLVIEPAQSLRQA
jgi:putative ABC transport system permease protein